MSKVGLTFIIDSFKIEPGKIKEFAMAVGDNNPIYYDRHVAIDKGYKDIPVPPTFPTVIEMWGGLDFETLIQKLNLDPLKVLHGEQEYEYFADIYAGDTISCSAEVVSHIEKRRMDFITIQVVFKREEEIVLISRSNIIERKG